MNDEAPVFEAPEEGEAADAGCALITEFHEVREAVVVIRAHDGDDASTDNGKIDFRIVAGNDLGLFRVVPDPAAPSTAARVYPQRQLKGFYGNYSLVVQASDRGEPTNVARATFPVCVQVSIFLATAAVTLKVAFSISINPFILS